MTVRYREKLPARFLAILFLWVWSAFCVAQTNPRFNVHLSINYESAERCIGLYEGLSGNGRSIAPLRGSRIALGTTADLERRSLTLDDLAEALDAAKFGQVVQDDVFDLRKARRNVAAIKTLLAAIKQRNFSQRVVSTVEQLFPADAAVSTTVPLYFVAFGHRNLDAYVRRIVWYGDTPVFVGEGEGELTIVVNLVNAVQYGPTVEDQFIGVLSVVAHEVFHAAFGAYKDASPSWRRYYETHAGYLDELLDLTQNEGIAHHFTFEQRSRGSLPVDWDERIVAAFDEFNRAADELLSPHVAPYRAHEIIARSNTSEYWKSYGAITGMFIARTIDRMRGRAALAATVALGADEFFKTYIALSDRDNSLPPLSRSIRQHLDIR